MTLVSDSLVSSLSLPVSQSLPKLMCIKLVMSSSLLILCCPLLLVPQSFPASGSELAVRIQQPEYWSLSLSFNINPSNEYSGLIFLRIWLIDLISLLSKGLSRVFSSTTIWKHQFFDIQPSLWSNSHICTWLLERPQLWLYRLLSAKWYLCFLIHCLGLSYPSFQ